MQIEPVGSSVDTKMAKKNMTKTKILITKCKHTNEQLLLASDSDPQLL